MTMSHADDIDTIAAARANDDAAWSRLVSEYGGTIRAASRAVPSPDPDGMYGTAMEAFYRAVMTYDHTSGIRFSRHAFVTMSLDVRMASGSDRIIALNNDAFPRYLRVLRAAGGDIGAAYTIAAAGGYGISPTSLLTIHRIVRAGGDIDTDVIGARPVGGPVNEEVPAGFADEVLSCLDPFDRDVVRLRCGFRDARLDAMRSAAGFREDDALTAREVAVVLGRGRRTIDRAFARATDAMRAYLQDAVDAGLRY